VGSWSSLKIAGVDVFHWKSEVDPTFLFLFTSNDIIDRSADGPFYDPFPPPTFVLQSTVRVLAERLDALGIAADHLEDCLQHAIGEELPFLDRIAVEPWNETWFEDEAEAADLRSMTMDVWLQRIRITLATPATFPHSWRDNTRVKDLVDMWELFDPRWLLRALLEACDPNSDVLLDLTELEFDGYLDKRTFEPQRAATAMFRSAIASGTPAVVLTEGTTDVEFLRTAVELRRPHLAGFIRFFDFGNTAGGAPAAITTIKAFAAAGISNRVIVMLDNDTAAHEAVRGLRNQDLPSHYVISHYADLDVGADYPTTGPTGEHRSNINGLAGSIELYLGRDVLTDPATKDFRPVQWGAYNRTLSAYQGEITGKGAIHESFRAKALAAREDASLLESQDWSGLDTVLDSLMELLRTCGVPDPAMREGFVR
jgi:hypothetical protein